MTSFPGSPRLLKGGIVQVHPDTGAALNLIPLQYNPDTLSRSLQVRSVTDSGNQLEALRVTGPPVETLKLDIELDATDQLEFPEQNPTAAQLGLHAQLAALELLIYPESAQLQANNRLAQSGTLEIAPAQSPLTLFIWSKQRVLPVRLTEFTITEEAFDPALNPIRARVSLGMRILSVNDLRFEHRGGSLFMAHQQQKEALAKQRGGGTLNSLGVTRIA